MKQKVNFGDCYDLIDKAGDHIDEYEKVINSFPADTSGLKSKIEALKSKYPSLKKEAESFLKLLISMEETNRLCTEDLDSSQNILKCFEEYYENDTKSVGLLRDVVSMEYKIQRAEHIRHYIEGPAEENGRRNHEESENEER